MNRQPLLFVISVLAVALIGAKTGFAAERPDAFPSISNEYLVENWQTEEGLPRNSITTITQDRVGYLWLGTPYGLIRFDGVSFVSFEHNTSPVLAQGEVRKVFVDRENTLWLATRRSSLLRCTMTNEQLHVERVPLPARLSVDSITQDRQGTLWITRGDGGLFKMVDGQLSATTDLSQLATGTLLFKLLSDARDDVWFYRQNSYGVIGDDGQVAAHVVIPDSVITLAPGRKGGMWLSTGTELRFLKPDETSGGEFVTVLPFELHGVTVMHEDRAGMLWIGTRGLGIFRWNGSKIQRINEINHTVRAIQEDMEGNLWVGTEGAGLFKLRPRQFQLPPIPSRPDENVISVSGDWLVPRSGGLGRIESDGRIVINEHLVRGHLTSVCDDQQGGIWVGTGSGQLIHLDADGRRTFTATIGVPGAQARVLYLDSRSNLWVGCFPNRLFCVPFGEENRLRELTATNFRHFTITAITEDQDGRIWVGTTGGEVHRQEGAGNRFVTYGQNAGLPGTPIGSLLSSRDGALWIGTLGGGLGSIPKNGSRFIPAPPDLCDNVVSQLIEDGEWLWAGTSHGLYRIDLEGLRAAMNGQGVSVASVHFGRMDGLPSVECAAGYQPSACKTASGQLRFATSKGVAMINSGMMPLNKLPPPLHLERVLVDGVPVSGPGPIRLSHQFRKIEFDYAALSFTSPDKVRFKRQLSGFDENWMEDGTKRSANYPRLPPGRYEFRVTACNNDGLWNPMPMVYSFEVKAAPWQTAWFKAVCLLVFAASIGGIARYVSTVRIRRRLRQLEQEDALNRERIRIARDLHDDLGARLTQMAFVTDLAAAEAGASPEMQAQLHEVSEQARLATRSLDETVWMVNPLKDSLPQLITYISHYANEFFRHTPISCRQRIGITLPDYPMPAEVRQHIFYTVKEILNNILKHSGATEVWLRIGFRGSRLRIVIRDNGVGFAPSDAPRHRHGLENMQRRLAAVGGRCILHSRPGRGTAIMLLVNLPEEGKPSRFSRRNHPSMLNHVDH